MSSVGNNMEIVFMEDERARRNSQVEIRLRFGCRSRIDIQTQR
jgi:hypothetical protein